MILSIQGHVLIMKHAKLKDLLQRATTDGLMPFSVSQEGDVYQLSHPLSIDERLDYKWLYAIEAAKIAQQDDGPPDGDGPRYA